ncbi:MAG: pentapeptide repeat-containing protein [Spirulina sp. SIO3F2]|nr:pentapeptide repeat-containing protein [Spirulina sp. SIO3F2]
MPNPRASTETLENIVEPARLKKGWNKLDDAWLDEAEVSQRTLQRFWEGKRLRRLSFSRICKALELDWKLVVAREEAATAAPAPVPQYRSEHIVLDLEIDTSVHTVEEMASLIDAMLTEIKSQGNSTVKLAYYEKGSIKLFLIGSQEDIARLHALITSGEFSKLQGHRVLGVRPPDKTEQEKINTIQSIRSGKEDKDNLMEVDLKGANLMEVDLKGANLIEADLREACLTGANLKGANLMGADLRGANLREVTLKEANLMGADLINAYLGEAYLMGANLKGANLKGADLKGADLKRANLIDTCLAKADVNDTRFWKNKGINIERKSDLKNRGAIFEDESELFELCSNALSLIANTDRTTLKQNR